MRHLLFKRTVYFVLLAEAKVKPKKIPRIQYCHVRSRAITTKSHMISQRGIAHPVTSVGWNLRWRPFGVKSTSRLAQTLSVLNVQSLIRLFAHLPNQVLQASTSFTPPFPK